MDDKVEAKSSKKSVNKITHLYLNDKYLKDIPKLKKPQDLLVLYLHCNEIFEIKNLENAVNLTSLYLHKNRIRKIQNLGNLKRLTKLYLGHNSINMMEGMQDLKNLEELYLEKQLLYEDNFLCFDPRSVFRIGATLRVLNVSNNRIQSIALLAPLRCLQVFIASHNNIVDIDEVCGVIKNWFYLKDLNFSDNPIAKDRLYKETIIANVYCLEYLDNKEVSDSSRNFLKRLHSERISHTLKPSMNLSNKIKDLPKNYPHSVQKAVSACLLKQHMELTGDDDMEIFDESKGAFIPWKTLPKPGTAPKLRPLTNKGEQVKQGKSVSTINCFSELKI